MLFIVISWIYIFFTSVSVGVLLSKWFKLVNIDVVFTLILGLFGVTLLASTWAFFAPIALGFHVLLVLLSLLFSYRNRATFKGVLESLFIQIKSFSNPITWLWLISSLLIIAQCASLPYVLDNETYYIQTIKWLNEYGFVKGLANLHLFFGQCSGWHITQSVYTFSFLYDRFNDLNGFCLLLGNYFAMQKLQQYFSKGAKLDLLFGLLPLTYVFLFQFISAPSPDLPVYIFAFILFSFFMESDVAATFSKINILALFAVYIKITAVVLVLLPLFLLIKNYDTVKRNLLPLKITALLTFLLWVLKNITLTGYPLFPLTFMAIPDLNYRVPKEIMAFFFSKNTMHSFYILGGNFNNLSLLQLLKSYFFHNGIDSIIALTTLVTVIIGPFVIYKYQNKKTLWSIYWAFLALLALLCLSSPQYRFYVYFTLFFGLFFISILLNNKRTILLLHGLSMMVVGIVLLVPISFKSLTHNSHLVHNSTFELKNILIPEPNSRWSTAFKGDSKGNLNYQTPIDDSFFWVTGNGKLPCVNTQQLDYFITTFQYMPQQRSYNLSDGFYAQKLNGHE
jgi:hypothetical protein